MNRIFLLALPALLLPQLAAAQTIVTDPQLTAVARQSLAVQQQQLAVLNNIQAIEQAQLNRPTAEAALAYARQQTQTQLQALAGSESTATK